MKNNNRDYVQDWIRLSVMDLKTAEHLYLHMHPIPIEIICFHCQQAVDKIIKALILKCGQEIPRAHDLGVLLDLIAENEIEVSDEQNAMCSSLSPFAVSIRYPLENDFSEEHAKKALQYAAAISLWITEEIEKINRDEYDELS